MGVGTRVISSMRHLNRRRDALVISRTTPPTGGGGGSEKKKGQRTRCSVSNKTRRRTNDGKGKGVGGEWGGGVSPYLFKGLAQQRAHKLTSQRWSHRSWRNVDDFQRCPNALTMFSQKPAQLNHIFFRQACNAVIVRECAANSISHNIFFLFFFLAVSDISSSKSLTGTSKRCASKPASSRVLHRNGPSSFLSSNPSACDEASFEKDTH